MCGIAGWSGRPPQAAGDAVLAALAHRGPDGQGRYDAPNAGVSLFHTRLAIIDLSDQGRQPMASADGRLVIVYNGEIYNYRELRAALQARGHVLQSQTDTEVILCLYRECGTELVEQLDGIYAFALWDAERRELFVARDRVGVKPLYFSLSGNAFSFASEIKALTAMPWVERRLDTQAVAHYLRYLWCPAPRTPLADVRKLEPGTALVVRDGAIVRQWRHWELPAPGPDAGPGVADWTRDVRAHLEAAVERQMVADVPVGAFLSGGLDSSAVVAFARRHTSARLQCFTIDVDAEQAAREGFERDLPYAQRVAKHLDVDLHVVTAAPAIADELERMVWHLDEPQADPAALNVLLISRLARQAGIKVLLSGAGGDDVFTGYRRHRALMLDRVWGRLPAPLRRAAATIGRRLPVGRAWARRAAKFASTGALDGDARIAAYFDWADPHAVARMFRPDVAPPGEEPLRAALAAMPATATPLQRMLLLEQRYFLGDHNLNYADKMSMAAGVETRVPFLDPALMQLAARIPDRLRQHGREGKWILKQALAGVLPDDVIWRPKTGFGVPLRAWLRGPLEPMLRDLLSREAIERRGLFDANVVDAMIAENAAGRADWSYTLFGAMCVELWCRRFLG